MHELSLMTSVLDAIEEQAAREPFSRVYGVSLEVGALCNVEVEALVFCFDIVMKGSLAEQASLDIIVVSGTGRCRQCWQAFQVSSWVDPCPCCGACNVDINGGNQLIIKALEVE